MHSLDLFEASHFESRCQYFVATLARQIRTNRTSSMKRVLFWLGTNAVLGSFVVGATDCRLQCSWQQCNTCCFLSYLVCMFAWVVAIPVARCKCAFVQLTESVQSTWYKRCLWPHCLLAFGSAVLETSRVLLIYVPLQCAHAWMPWLLSWAAYWWHCSGQQQIWN